MGNVAGARRVSRPARAMAANAAAVQRSNTARSPTRATALPVSTRTSAYKSVRSNSVSARAGASDQVAEASVQIASSASAPEANANAGLHPANGLLATVIRTTRVRQRVNP